MGVGPRASQPQAADPRGRPGGRGPSSARALAFLALAIVGLLGQLVLFGAFLADKGLDLGGFADRIFSSTIAALTFADLTMCALVFPAWLRVRRQGRESAAGGRSPSHASGGSASRSPCSSTFGRGVGPRRPMAAR